MKRFLTYILLSITPSLLALKKPIPAFCSVPVADLVSQKFKPGTILEHYAALPLSENRPLSFSCRATQLLFNDRVLILEQNKEQSFVETSCWHLKTPSSRSPGYKNNRFWTLTKNLCPLSTLTADQQATIPPTDSAEAIEKIIILFLPWHCPETATTYSAGTKFVIYHEDKEQYQIQLYHPTLKHPVISLVNKELCILNKKRSEIEKRKLFVKILQQWAHGIPDQIPYVLGGASIISTFKNPLFEEKKITLDGEKNRVFTRPECTVTPHTGVDCAGIIRLACNIVGIPLTATNSRSIAESFSKLSPTAPLQNGDLLCWKGHVAIVSDTTKGLLIEARGYEHGYGYVQEIPYQAQFKGIITTEDLINAYHTKKPIKRLNKKGRHQETITTLQILSLFPLNPTP